ncbi:hypothetical protein D9M68_380670 [compost metagenome]
MNSAPFPVSTVIAHLVAQVTAFQQVQGAAEYSAIRSLTEFRPDSAFVLLARERGDGEPPKAGRQRAIATFGVVIAVQNYRDLTGGESIQDISPLIGQARAALMGWTPPVDGGRPCRWIQGDVLDFDNSTLLWADVFETQHFIGGAP